MLSRPTFGKYFIATDSEQDNGPPLGMMMIHFETSIEVGGLIYWINSVYIRPESRRIGVFRALYDHVLALAKSDPWVKCVRLYVELTNKRAQTVYEKVGMVNLDQQKEFHEIDYKWTSEG